MKTVVVGDVLLDVDLTGRAERLSPDAPVPVVEVELRHVRAGGAGLVASLLEHDGCPVELVTVLSSDEASAELRRAFGALSVVAGASGAATPVKTRLRAGSHAIARIDEGCGPAPVPVLTSDMEASIRSADAIVVADYGRGLLEAEELRALLSEVGRTVPIVWDPHPRGAVPIAEATIVTPNLVEALAASGVSGATGGQSAVRAASALRERWGVAAVVVTLGQNGALLSADGESPQVFPAPAVTVADPCGAGDRFAATLARELGQGWEMATAVHTAVVDAAEFLHAGGVASLQHPLASAPTSDEDADVDADGDADAAADGDAAAHADADLSTGAHAVSADSAHAQLASLHRMSDAPADAAPHDVSRTAIRRALEIVRAARAAGKTVVATGGCFDILHAGHARTLQRAREHGDCLIVCLNSDDSVRRLKGEERPIMSQDDRAELLLALGSVDAVVVFDEDTPEAVLARLRPDVWVKGGDYSVDELPESRLLATWGGRTVTVPFYPGRSTTKLAYALAQVS